MVGKPHVPWSKHECSFPHWGMVINPFMGMHEADDHIPCVDGFCTTLEAIDFRQSGLI